MARRYFWQGVYQQQTGSQVLDSSFFTAHQQTWIPIITILVAINVLDKPAYIGYVHYIGPIHNDILMTSDSMGG